MSKLTALYFACNRDLEMLKVSAARFADEGIRVVASFDESDNPPSSIPGVDDIMTTTFPRGFSLNQTPQCVAGMLACFYEVANKLSLPSDGHLIKIDCDTMLTKPEALTALDMSGFDLIGQEGEIKAESKGMPYHSFRYVKGHAYALSVPVITRIHGNDVKELLLAADAHCRHLLSGSPTMTWAEDETISTIVRLLKPDINRHCLFGDQPYAWVGTHDFDLGAAPPAVFKNFGNLYNTTKGAGRDTILSAMQSS